VVDVDYNDFDPAAGAERKERSGYNKMKCRQERKGDMFQESRPETSHM
jgi:hypothetical protein